MICWWCFWGWPVQVRAIYDRAVQDIDALLPSDWRGEPRDGEAALHWGPAHVVWEDENFEDPSWCLENCDSPAFDDWHKGALEIVRRSLRELAALPAELRTEPPGYDGEHPESFPMPPDVVMVK